MITKLPDGKPVIRDGKEVQTKDTLCMSKESSAEYTKYLKGPKDDYDVIDPVLRTSYSKSNFLDELGKPPVWGEPDFNKRLDKYAEDASELKVKRQRLFSELRTKRSDKTRKDPIEQEIIISLKHEEIEDIPLIDGKYDYDKIAERMYALGEQLIRDYTNKKDIINDYDFTVHIKDDPDRPGKIMPDMHILLGYYDRKGFPLKLGIDKGLERISNAHQAMEHMKKFPFLLKTKTEAWERKGALISKEQVNSVTSLIDKILADNSYDPAAAHKAFIAAKIKITPSNNVDKNKSFIQIDYQGVKYRTSNDNFDKSTSTQLFRYTEQKKFQENNPKVNFKELSQFMQKKFTEFEGKPIELLINALSEKGIISIPNLQKGNINGMSFYLPVGEGVGSKESKIKSSALGFDVTKYKATPNTGKKVLEAGKENLNAAISLIEEKEPVILNGVEYLKDSLGNVIPIKQDKKKRKEDFAIWMKWAKGDSETLPEFQARMLQSKNNQILMLKAIYFKMESNNIAYSTYNHRKMFELLSDKNVTIYQKNKSSIKAGLQALISMNQLSEEEKARGVKLVVEITGTNTEKKDMMWLEAKNAGLSVSNYRPSDATYKAYRDGLDAKMNKDRQQNRRRLERFLMDSKDHRNSFGRKLVLDYNKTLDNDVDRRVLCLTYVDAFKLGVDRTHLFNPPKLHVNDRRRLYKRDIVKHQELMLETVKNECPERYEEFKREIERYTSPVKALSESPDLTMPVIPAPASDTPDESERKRKPKAT